jgi:glutamyl-tRNA reductase
MRLDPLAAVSLTFRDAPSAARTRAAEPFGPAVWDGLRAQGASGIVELHTCARSLWLVSSPHPAWAGALVQSSVAARCETLPTLFAGEEAFRFSLRVAVGLDSFVQGEADIGAQFARAFADARSRGRGDGVLNLVAQSAARLVAEGRETGFIRPNRGLGQLATQALARLGADKSRPVGVVGAGAIGSRVVASLKRAGWVEPVVYNRTPREGVLPISAIGDHEALVLCTAGPEGWFTPADSHVHVIDLGLPAQARGGARPVVGLDALLAGDELKLGPERTAKAEAAVERELGALFGRVRRAHLQRGLQGVVALRDQFVESELDALLSASLADLPEDQQRRVLAAARGAVRQFGHRMVTWMREEMQVDDGEDLTA